MIPPEFLTPKCFLVVISALESFSPNLQQRVLCSTSHVKNSCHITHLEFVDVLHLYSESTEERMVVQAYQVSK